MSIDVEKLIAYADGELGDQERAEVESALAGSAELRAQLEAHRALRAKLSDAFDPVLAESAPAHLLAAVQTQGANVVSLASRRRPQWSAREWGAMAASLAGGLILGLGVMNAQAPMIAATHDGLSARGALAQALDSQLAADAGGAVRIGLSFRNRDGAYCRTFEIASAQTAGLACHGGSDWRVAMTAQARSATGEVRTAGSETPPQILSAVETSIEGDPLDAAAEARARAAGWR